MRSFLISMFIISILGGCQQNPERTASSASTPEFDPVIDAYLADPHIIKHEDRFYLYATGEGKDGREIPVYSSTDLKNWKFESGAVEPGDSLDWNYKNFWAPEVIKLKDSFYLYYTASPGNTPKNHGNRVGVAVSPTPTGPFTDKGVVVHHASLDGSPFVDTDGQLYLLYTIETGNKRGLTMGQIYIDRMQSPYKVADSARVLVDHLGWQEGPNLIHKNGRYYLSYSTGGWKHPTYHVRYGVSDSLFGPYTEQLQPLIAETEVLKGPGHSMFFTDNEQKTYFVFHSWDTAMTKRYPFVRPITFEGEKAKVQTTEVFN